MACLEFWEGNRRRNKVHIDINDIFMLIFITKRTVCVPLASVWMHPPDFSCSVLKSFSTTPPLPCSFAEGDSPRGTDMLTKPATVLNIHKCLSQTENRLPKSNQYLHTEVCFYKRKLNMETFHNFKSQCSVTKHFISLIQLTNYTWVVLPKDTQASTLKSSITAGDTHMEYI